MSRNIVLVFVWTISLYYSQTLTNGKSILEFAQDLRRHCIILITSVNNCTVISEYCADSCNVNIPLHSSLRQTMKNDRL